MWPLGYDVKDRKLVVNRTEAETVRHIHRRYLGLASVFDLQDELRESGIGSKARIDRHGRTTGGKPLARGALYLMLQNRIYRGEIVHKGACYKGEHEAIIDGRRVPAGDLEGLVEGRLRSFLASERDVYNAVEHEVGDVAECSDLVARAADLGRRWPDLAAAEKRAILFALVDRVGLTSETVEVAILPRRLAAILRAPGDQHLPRARQDGEATIALSVPARLKRAGVEMKLLIDDAEPRRKPDRSLGRLLAQAHRFNTIVMRGNGKSISALAAEAGVGRSYFTRILRLSFLAPDIIKTILRDCHPLDLTAKRLANNRRLAVAWTDQRALLAKD